MNLPAMEAPATPPPAGPPRLGGGDASGPRSGRGRSQAYAVRQRWADRLFHGTTFFFGLLVFFLLAAILVSLWWGSRPALHRFGFFAFATSTAWNPVTEQFGALVDIYGTLITSAIAMLLGIPVSFGIALFVTELC